MDLRARLLALVACTAIGQALADLQCQPRALPKDDTIRAWKTTTAVV